MLIRLVKSKRRLLYIPDKLQKILKAWQNNLKKLSSSLVEDTNKWDINGTELSKMFSLFKSLKKMPP